MGGDAGAGGRYDSDRGAATIANADVGSMRDGVGHGV